MVRLPSSSRFEPLCLTNALEQTLYRDPDSEFEGELSRLSRHTPAHNPVVEIERIVADEENLLQIVEKNSQEAITSCLSLHWVNDLPGTNMPYLLAVHLP